MQVFVHTVGVLSSVSSQAVNLSYSESPIHRLPVELLQHVFLLIIKDVPDYPSIFSFGGTTISGNFARPPLLFTRVCRLWRAVAHSTTGIWSHIKVGLPTESFPLKPFLPSLLRSWLAWSGSQPLTIRMEYISPSVHGHFCPSNTQLLEILFAETTRWETVFCMFDVFERSENFNAPQLRTLQCNWPSDVTRFNAPNLRRIRFGPLSAVIRSRPTATCKNIRHLRIQSAPVAVIHSSLSFFPHVETLVIDYYIAPNSDSGSHTTTYSCLESMTIPLFHYHYHRDPFIELFRGLRLPMLQKLNVVGNPDTPEVEGIITALAVAESCNIQVVDFQPRFWTNARRNNVYIRVEPLLSVAREVAICGEVVARRALGTT
ncbi:uncharacterized protein F5147DRAFT_706206 [Suillus discolor]|uniref:F-box domain-containing protein n=1 Tax=Suillus discolor TaxID=1912936 RepID=A0A9P7F348_9AGAM|nr:uncharacterized protein F5147DRAFT_706206 [Suillus discolor]KAG2103472.1 hypothetical protein F5147DRAFT_706206 [Suillus discolor]